MAGVELPPAVNDGDVSESEEEKPLNVEDPGRDAHLRPTEPVQFMEIFSNPRIAPEVRRLGQTCGPSIDLGTGWDLTKKAVQQRLLQLLYVLQPLVLMLCPPCTVFSCVQNTMRDRRADYKKWEKQYAEGLFVQICFADLSSSSSSRTQSGARTPLAGKFLDAGLHPKHPCFARCVPNRI